MKKIHKDKDGSRGHFYKIVGFSCLILAIFFFFQIVHYPLIIPLILCFFMLLLFSLAKITVNRVLHLSLLLVLFLFTIHVFREYSIFSVFYIPVAGFTLITLLLFNDLFIAFLMALSTSFMASLIFGGKIELFLIFLLGALAGIFAIRGANTRGQLIKAGLAVSFTHGVCLILLNPHSSSWTTAYFFHQQLKPLIFNGLLSAFFALAVLKIFETIFGVLTNFSLMELAQAQHPLLKRMRQEAPGTWQHSLLVGQLSESAAETIGANSLLAKVGSYFHDVGKTLRAQYYVENQNLRENKHDDIEPSMSGLVLRNHVKEGIDLAKKYKLNPALINFIPEHHGTSVMTFFYQKALEEAGHGESVNENDFRYPGPKPQTKETAVTLLADSVEGATRALADPTPSKIEETVKKIITSRFLDGQLDECDLTLRDIEKIQKVFVHILTAVHHGRIPYPDVKNEYYNSQFPEDDSYPHSSDSNNY